MMICSLILIIQNVVKLLRKEPVQTYTFHLLTEIKALLILGILIMTYLICKVTDLFVLGAVFCAVSFLLYFRCRKKSYYVITLGLSVLIWAVFRFGLNVKF